MLKLNNININYNDFSLTNFSLNIEKGDYYVILGESGAGKSIILELIAGIIHPDSGTIHLNGKDITKVSIQKREIGIVFQDYAVFPHLNVFDNIAYPIRSKRLSKKDIRNNVLKTAEKLEIKHLLKRKTNDLSGGELQRVALARTLILKPKCLLLDEPLVSLDVRLRENLRELLRKLNNQGQTIVHVTHEYEEALSLSGKIAVMHNGKLIQKGKPDEIFHNPKSEFVAKFTGVKNFFKARYTSANKVLINDVVTIQVNPDKKMCEGYIMIPSESIVISLNKQKSSAINNFNGIITSIFSSRFGKEIVVDIGLKISVNITEESVQNLELKENKEVWISFKVNSVKFVSKK
ncbi:MAG: ABC transporter ATP-binding protein [Bacteroidales bacterium]|nr:ABC transporter ATP-binding protein [Bacteroidales bacterium]